MPSHAPPTLWPAAAADAVEGVEPRWIIEPSAADELSRAVAWARGEQLSVVPRGGGTKLSWGNPPGRADVILSTRRLNRVLEHAAGDMTATVEAGCTVAEFQKTLARHGQRFALDPLFPERATIGGILATNDYGPLRYAFGSLRDLVLGITVALPDGTLARSGGKVVKNVAGYDLPKLMTGALGTLGVITEATFRLHPLPAAVIVVSSTAPTPEDAGGFMLAVQASTLAVAAVQVTAARDAPFEVLVRVEGSQAGVTSAAERLSTLAREYDLAPMAPSPDNFCPCQRLWENLTPEAVVCKLTFLPARFTSLCTSIEGAATEGWTMIAQAYGAALLRIDGSSADAAAGILETLRRQVRVLDGSLTVLHADVEVKRRIDAWGAAGDALRLMRRVKEQFDPTGVLNPGRFVGGI